MILAFSKQYGSLWLNTLRKFIRTAFRSHYRSHQHNLDPIFGVVPIVRFPSFYSEIIASAWSQTCQNQVVKKHYIFKEQTHKKKHKDYKKQ